MSTYDMPPFLKWAGGKRWLATNFSDLIPKKFNRYIEPFLGSGAIFFHLNPKSGVLSDANPDLVETYNAIKNDWQKVEFHLKRHSKLHSESYYYQVRDTQFKNEYSRAARFIYLNRTCFNGLYRVNLQGKFNVPKGTKENVILPSDNFEAIANLLKGFDIVCSDFESVIDQSKKDDLLFVDPPYTVKHNENGFVKYNEKLFSWDDQLRLQKALLRAKRRGVIIILTNAKHKSIRSLYKDDFNLKTLNRKNSIAASSEKRGAFDEYFITSNFIED